MWLASKFPIPKSLKRKPVINSKIIFSIVIGIISHNLIDTLMLHGGRAMPLLWPLTNEKYVFLLFNNAFFSNIFWHAIGIILTIYCLKRLLKEKSRQIGNAFKGFRI